MNYTVIPKSIVNFQTGNSKPIDIYVWATIKYCSNYKTNISHITEEKLSLLTGLDERTIRRSIKRLKDAGYLTVQTTVKEDADRGFIKRNSYFIKPANKDYFFLDNSFFKRNYPAKIAGFLLLLKSVCLNNTDTIQWSNSQIAKSIGLSRCTAPQKLDTFGVFFMKYNYEIRLKAVKLVLEGGLSVREAGCHLGCGRSQVHLWVTLFERHGLAGLKLRHGSYSAEFKLSVLKHMHQNHLSLLETAVHFGIPGPFVIRQWERLYQNQGAEGLRRKPQRRRPAMSKSKTKKVKLKTTPHEELLKELEYLRAENAYLKKLQALVEERIVRESGKEPKPSKD